MQYQKVISGETIIELHNNWLGEETVIVNGHIVSKKSSVWGTNHYFSVVEDGHTARYILTTKVTENMQIVLDLSKNGELIHDSIPIQFGSRPKRPQDEAKKKGLAKLNEYALEEALVHFNEAVALAPKDAEVYFHMACAYSVLEETSKGFECLKKAVEYGLPNTEMILNHDLLAFIRMHTAFEEFLNSGFKKYDETLVSCDETNFLNSVANSPVFMENEKKKAN